jgi:hypothetical protein
MKKEGTLPASGVDVYILLYYKCIIYLFSFLFLALLFSLKKAISLRAQGKPRSQGQGVRVKG